MKVEKGLWRIIKWLKWKEAGKKERTNSDEEKRKQGSEEKLN